MTTKEAIIFLISKAVSQDASASKQGVIPEGLTYSLKSEDDDYGEINEHYVVTYYDIHMTTHKALVRVDAVNNLITPVVILNI